MTMDRYERPTTNIERVAEFHERFGVDSPKHPAFPDTRTMLVRLQLIQEELGELTNALAGRDMVGVLDALCDLSYVVDGTWLAMGLANVRYEALYEVHRSNMSKLGADGKPIISASGRVVKGPGYTPPALDALLARYERRNGLERAK